MAVLDRSVVCFFQRKSILRVSLCDEVERQLKAKTGSKVKTIAGCGQFQTTKGDLKNNLDGFLGLGLGLGLGSGSGLGLG